MLKRWFLDDDGMVRPPAAYGTIALAVLLLGLFAYRAWTKGEHPTTGTWICMDCAKLADVTPKIGGDLPAKCPHCDKVSLVPAYACSKCKTPQVLNEYRGLKPPTKCTKCGAEVWYGR
ncbi:MAG TPA: hypothetical protein VLM89_10360 [Phycisphaerae bacterium]|nr:hypothetical protein [Phycisphaerae bacterium]